MPDFVTIFDINQSSKLWQVFAGGENGSDHQECDATVIAWSRPVISSVDELLLISLVKIS